MLLELNYIYTLKKVCVNFGFTGLSKPADILQSSRVIYKTKNIVPF